MQLQAERTEGKHSADQDARQRSHAVIGESAAPVDTDIAANTATIRMAYTAAMQSLPTT